MKTGKREGKEGEKKGAYVSLAVVFLRSRVYSAAMEKNSEDVNNLQDYAKAKLQSFSWKKMHKACSFNNDQPEFL